MNRASRMFLDESANFLRGEFMPRIREAVALLNEEEIWWRPNEASNSIGNLLLHLSGNVRQWIVWGVGGVPIERNRQAEFTERVRVPADELMTRLTLAVEEALGVLSEVSEESLLETRMVRGREVSGLYAIYHVVEHFSMHTGQILLIAKHLLDRDLGFSRTEDGDPPPQWAGPSLGTPQQERD